MARGEEELVATRAHQYGRWEHRKKQLTLALAIQNTIVQSFDLRDLSSVSWVKMEDISSVNVQITYFYVPV